MEFKERYNMKNELLRRIECYLVTMKAYDDVSFADFIIDKKALNLSNSEFLEYLELFLKAFFDNNGKVVIGAEENEQFDWVLTSEYGTTPKEIANNLLAALEKHQRTKPDEDDFMFGYGIWFVENSNRIKKD